ncbi:MFS transporter, partial [bacterium]|nr:MFS transporter [bacterium]
VFNFIVTGIFPVLLYKTGGSCTFLIFVGISIISMLFIHFIVPETKGISLEEIEAKFK